MDKFTVRRMMTELMKLPESRWDDLLIVEASGVAFEVSDVNREVSDVVIVEAS